MDLHVIICGSAHPLDKQEFAKARFDSLAKAYSMLQSYPDVAAALFQYLSHEHLAITWAAQSLPSNQDSLMRRADMSSEQRAIQRLVLGLSRPPVSPQGMPDFSTAT